MQQHDQGNPDRVQGKLYEVGRGLGFSLAHIRDAIDSTKNPDELLRKWQRWATEEIRYLAWPSSGRGDYTTDFWKSMREEPEPMEPRREAS